MNKNTKTIIEANILQNQIVYHIIAKILLISVEKKLGDYVTDAPIELSKLAKKLGYHPKAACRFFRMLETLNLLTITKDNFIKSTKLTAFLQHLQSEHFYGSFVTFNYFEESLKHNKECWSNAFGDNFYSHLSKHPKKFIEFQQYCTVTAENWLTFISTYYKFKKQFAIVDVGGGTGFLLSKIILENPTCSGVLFEKPEIANKAKKYLKSQNSDQKIEVISGDFFTDTIPKGNIYLLCRVMLNWDDFDAVKIINNCVKSMSAKDKLLIVDFVIPNKKHKHYQRAVIHDLNLLAILGGGIRSIEEWKILVKKTHCKLIGCKIIDEEVSPSLNVPMVILELKLK